MKALTLATVILIAAGVKGQPRAEKYVPVNCTLEFQENAVHVVKGPGSTALVWLVGKSFSDGTIELDLKGKEVRGESFLGIAFHALNDLTYSAVYFRPFNFRVPDRKDRAVQYVDVPGNDWDVLREKHPGKYESAVSPVPDPNDWFHTKIVIRFPEIRVYVSRSAEPSLVVKAISARTDGKIGFWVDSADGWFRNLKITRQ